MKIRSALIIAAPIFLLLVVAGFYFIPRLMLQSDAGRIFKGLSQLSASQIDGYKGRNTAGVESGSFDQLPLGSLFDDSSDLHKGYKTSGAKLPITQFSQRLVSLSANRAVEEWQFTSGSRQQMVANFVKSNGKWQLSKQSFANFVTKAIPATQYKKLLFIDSVERTPAAEIVQPGYRVSYLSSEDTFYVQLTRAPVDAQKQAFLALLQQAGVGPSSLKITYYLSKGL